MNKVCFTLTKEHVKLLQGFNVQWDSDAYEGAPTVDLKRPYGNSSGVALDICWLLTGERIGYTDSKRDSLTKAETERYNQLHREMETALQVVLATASFTPGTYERQPYDYRSWHLVK